MGTKEYNLWDYESQTCRPNIILNYKFINAVMDRKNARVRASRYRSLLTTSKSLDRGGAHRSRKSNLNLQLPHYDPAREDSISFNEHEFRYYTMFRYATWKEIVLMIIGVCCAILWGFTLPALLYLWLEVILDEEFCRNEKLNNSTLVPSGGKLVDLDSKFLQLAILFCCSIFTFCSASTGAFVFAAEKQICKIRMAYFESILRKDMAWLDNYVQREFGRHMTHDVTILRNGIGERVPYLVYNLVVVPTLLIVAFRINWLMTLVTISVLFPSMVGAGNLSFYFEKREQGVEDQLSDKAEAFAEQVLSNIKAVKIFNAEDYEFGRYSLILRDVRKLWRYTCYAGICIFLLWAIYYYASALTLHFGHQMTDENSLNQTTCRDPILELPQQLNGPGALFVIFLSAVLATLHWSEAVTIFSIFAETKSIAAEVFFMIDWKPRIDNMSSQGDCPGPKAVGKIQFENVCFKYPRKADISVLQFVNLTVQLGQLVGILGDSLSGKSTILRLMQRLYDPTAGCVYFDGRPMESLNVGWLRSQIGHVPQKPVLFNKTVEENVRFANWTATQTEVQDACRKAGIHEDILLLPEGYETMVGTHGLQMSLAQRRQIAFARAYLQRPKVILLDDAVSGSDKEFEESLLSTINELRQNTTVVITASEVNSIVRQCDRIYVLDRGHILEQGNHAALMENEGLYSMIANGMSEGLPEQTFRLTSQLKSYNFAKTLRKWKLDRGLEARKRRRRSMDSDAENADEDEVESAIDDAHYQYQRKTRGIAWIAGGFNSYHYARRNTEAYSLREGDKGVKKSKNVGGLAVLRRKISKIKQRRSVFSEAGSIMDMEGVTVDPTRRESTMSQAEHNSSEREGHVDRSRTLSVLFSVPQTEEMDNVSIQSEHYGEFWDEYETVLDCLDDDTSRKSWKDVFAVGFHGSWIIFLAIFISSALGVGSTLCHSIYGTFYEELTHSRTLQQSKELTPSIRNFLIVGSIVGVFGFSQNIVFILGGFKLTAKLKEKLFRKILEQDLEWFDMPENDISILCQRLSIDTVAIENALLITFGVISQSLCSFLSSILIIIIGHQFHGSPEISPYIMTSLPMSMVLIALLYIDGRLQLNWNAILNRKLQPVTEIEVDVVSNIRTVITLGLEEHFLGQMTGELKKAERKVLWLNIFRTFLFGLTRVFPYLIYTVIAVQSLRATDADWHILLITELLIQNQIRTGIGLAMLPSTESARAAASRIRNIFRQKSLLAGPSESQATKVEFLQPPSVTVKNLCYNSPNYGISLNNINFHIKSNGFLGIVGIGMDSGTSTLINVLARFYKPTSGEIFFDETDIWSMDLKTFRRESGFVEESPTIFASSIKDNIAYGADSEKISIDEIVDAAMKMNIHDLIIRLPQGYDTMAGAIGNEDRMCGLLQRLILARALVRNPKVILVDGNTTSINEQEDLLLQDALNVCGTNRTKIVAMERISSVQHADYIIVLQGGEIIEEGTHRQLVAKRKLYYQMYMNQMAATNSVESGSKQDISGVTRSKRRSLLAYERYLQKRMFTQAPRATRFLSSPTAEFGQLTRPSIRPN